MAVKHERLISDYDEALKNQNLTAQDREFLELLRTNAVHDREFYPSELSAIKANPTVGPGRPVKGSEVDVKQKRTDVLAINNPNIHRDASTSTSWDHLHTPKVGEKCPHAIPVNVDRKGVLLSDGTHLTNPDGSCVKNMGGDGKKYGINLRTFVNPQDKGGYGAKCSMMPVAAI